MKYHPEYFSNLYSDHNLVTGPCMAGSLTGAVASSRVPEAFKGWLVTDGNRDDSVCAKASLTARATTQADTKVGANDPLYRSSDQFTWERQRTRIKVTLGITG